VRKALGLLLTPIVLAATLGVAAALPVSGGLVQGGGDADLLCDEDGVELSYSVSGGSITDATVSGIADDCDGVSMIVVFDVDPGSDQTFLVFVVVTDTYSFNLVPDIPVTELSGVTITWAGIDDEVPNQGD